MTDWEALLILNAIPGLGNARITKLVEHFGSVGKVLSVQKTDLMTAQIIPQDVAKNIVDFDKDAFLSQETALIKKHGVDVLTIYDEGYPKQLKEIPDAPVVFYVKGQIPEDKGLVIAVVGSRKASIYGITVTSEFSGRLAELGVTVVSGMARGIDTAAHQGALKAHGLTVAVLGCGLSHIYPKENEKLMEEITQNGAVISEFPMDTPPFANNFPRRNRIIAGLSLGVLVVEAREKSGALITADFALEQGREVYAIPGKIDNPSTKGVHNLIKQGAKLATCVEDILEDLEPRITASLRNRTQGLDSMAPTGASKDIGQGTRSDLTEGEQLIYNHLNDRPVHIDELMARYPSAAVVLLQLEMKRLVQQLPGKMFKRI